MNFNLKNCHCCLNSIPKNVKWCLLLLLIKHIAPENYVLYLHIWHECEYWSMN